MNAMAMYAPPADVTPEMLAAIRALPGRGNRAVIAHRQACAGHFSQAGIPSMRHEDWKYTDLPRALDPWWSRLSAPVSTEAVLDAGVLDALRLNDLDVQRLVFVDGRFHPGLSDAPFVNDGGMYAGPVAPLLDAPPSWLLPVTDEWESPLYHGLNAANGALYADGLAVHVPVGQALPRPIQAIFLSRGGQVSHPRNHICLAADARATVIEQFASIMQAFLYVDLVLGLIVIVSSIFIVANTVRLTILSRQKSIEVLKLVGATNRFITTPFVIEGAVQGGLAAIFSLALLLVIYLVLKGMLPDLAFLGPNKIGLYTITCILLGAVGSFASLRRHLKL